MAGNRFDRINEEVKRVVSEIIREMKDPRISPMTALMRAEVTRDLKWAKVWVSIYDTSEQARGETIKILNQAAGFIGHELGKRMEIRAIPQFKFILDSSIEYSVHISKILNEIGASEKKDGQ